MFGHSKYTDSYFKEIVLHFNLFNHELILRTVIFNIYKFHMKHPHYLLIRSNKMQQYAGIYLLQNHSTCFGYPSHPSSGEHKTVTAASGTGHSHKLPPTRPH